MGELPNPPSGKKWLHLPPQNKTVDVAQSVRASDCGSEGRRFEPGLPPLVRSSLIDEINNSSTNRINKLN